ncbi:MAG: flagellar hook-basal body protein [Ruminococcaceae bacterium]|nr:flagellar hook-basal body protein [Oscillospiraceae bacterium]
MSMIAFYTGASGMVAFQNGLDVTANNIANVNTNGYKESRASFQDLLYSRINTNVAGNHLVGHGVKQEYVDLLMGQSSFEQTNEMLDFAIAGDGFFEVDNNGKLEYTRNGAFDLSVSGDTATLVTGDGAYVLDRNGNRITLTRNDDGSYSTDDLTDRIAIYTFANPYGLEPAGDTNYVPSDNSGNPVLAIPGDPNAAKELQLLQGALEVSGVNLSKQMVNVIMYQRGFQMNARVLQTADQLAEEVNNLR